MRRGWFDKFGAGRMSQRVVGRHSGYPLCFGTVWAHPLVCKRESGTGALVRETYTADLERRGIGWTADIGWNSGHGKIGLDGPTFWRPTRKWVIRRAARHVRFRLWRHHRARHVPMEITPGGVISWRWE